MMDRIIWALPFMLMGIGAQAASFDCEGVSGEPELTICADPMLSHMDDVLGVQFNDSTGIYYDDPQNPALVKLETDQFAWVVDTQRPCGDDKACLMSAYMERVGALRENLSEIQEAADYFFGESECTNLSHDAEIERYYTLHTVDDTASPYVMEVVRMECERPEGYSTSDIWVAEFAGGYSDPFVFKAVETMVPLYMESDHDGVISTEWVPAYGNLGDGFTFDPLKSQFQYYNQGYEWTPEQVGIWHYDGRFVELVSYSAKTTWLDDWQNFKPEE